MRSSSSPSTVRRAPARAPSRARSPPRSGIGTSTAARCTAPSAGRPFATNVPLDDEDAVAALAERSRIEIADARVTIDGDDVTREIRTPEIDRAAASVARLPRVRAMLVARQRELGAGGGIVMEGRDIGTVVFPRRRREDLPRRVARGARAAPGERSGAHRRAGRRRRSGHAAHRARRARSHARRLAALCGPGRRRRRHDGEVRSRRSWTR